MQPPHQHQPSILFSPPQPTKQPTARKRHGSREAALATAAPALPPPPPGPHQTAQGSKEAKHGRKSACSPHLHQPRL
eukprot:350209-Chlamydomonas_euryale.AAC.3